MCKAIYFDMDGTVADLYGVRDWEPMLRAHISDPYRFAAPMCDMLELHELLQEFVARGVTIGVISWGAIGATRAYNAEVRRVKREWCRMYMPTVSEFHVVSYDTPKHRVAKIKDAVLVDDNAGVRDAWNIGATIDATDKAQMIQALRDLLAELED